MSFPSQVIVQVFEAASPFGGVQVQADNESLVQLEVDSGSPVQSVFGRVGDIQPQCSDYAACYAPSARGVPPGGLINQVLKKNSSGDYDTSWGSAAGIAVPVTTNLMKGDAAGGFADSGIAPGDVTIRQPTYTTPTTINQIVSCLRAAGLCA